MIHLLPFDCFFFFYSAENLSTTSSMTLLTSQNVISTNIWTRARNFSPRVFWPAVPFLPRNTKTSIWAVLLIIPTGTFLSFMGHRSRFRDASIRVAWLDTWYWRASVHAVKSQSRFWGRKKKKHMIHISVPSCVQAFSFPNYLCRPVPLWTLEL